jgi:hypothetical protein
MGKPDAMASSRIFGRFSHVDANAKQSAFA